MDCSDDEISDKFIQFIRSQNVESNISKDRQRSVLFGEPDQKVVDYHTPNCPPIYSGTPGPTDPDNHSDPPGPTDPDKHSDRDITTEPNHSGSVVLKDPNNSISTGSSETTISNNGDSIETWSKFKDEQTRMANVLVCLETIEKQVQYCKSILNKKIQDSKESRISESIGTFFKYYTNSLRCKRFFYQKQCKAKPCELIHSSAESSVLAKEIRKLVLSSGQLENCPNLQSILTTHNPSSRKLSELLLRIVNDFNQGV